MSASAISDPRLLLGLPPSSAQVAQYVAELAELTTPKDPPSPEIKAYPDALYMNYYSLGLSLMSTAKDGSRKIKADDVHTDKLGLDSIDIYNVRDADKSKPLAGPSGAKSYSTYPVPSLVLSLVPSKDEKSRPSELKLTTSTTGKDVVACLGEPDRKGGGAGPSSGSIGIWCEWSRDGIMIEFGGDEARGPQAWERGKDAGWKVLTLFRPSVS